MVDYILIITLLFIAGNLGQIADILVNFGKNAEGIRLSDGTPFTDETGIGTLMKFYLRSRRVSLVTTTGLILILAIFGTTEMVTVLFPTIEGRSMLFFLLGYGGQQSIRDFFSVAQKRIQQ